MQHVKLYYFHKTAYFLVGFFVFKIDKTLSDQISTVQKRFFLNNMNSFVVIWSPHQPICFIKEKNKIYQKMQREKLYNLQRTACYIYAPFRVQYSLRPIFVVTKMYFFSTRTKFPFTYFLHKVNCSL